jgi:hypothetical protein
VDVEYRTGFVPGMASFDEKTAALLVEPERDDTGAVNRQETARWETPGLRGVSGTAPVGPNLQEEAGRQPGDNRAADPGAQARVTCSPEMSSI